MMINFSQNNMNIMIIKMSQMTNILMKTKMNLMKKKMIMIIIKKMITDLMNSKKMILTT